MIRTPDRRLSVKNREKPCGTPHEHGPAASRGRLMYDRGWRALQPDASRTLAFGEEAAAGDERSRCTCVLT